MINTTMIGSGSKEEDFNLEEGVPRKLHVNMLKGIKLNRYPLKNVHYLTYALQFGKKLPSAQSMNRSEWRNKGTAYVERKK